MAYSKQLLPISNNKLRQLWLLVKGDDSYLPNSCSGPLQIAISLIPLTLQLSFFAKWFQFNISLSGLNHNHIS